jgi:hypothetical protein
MGVHVFQYKQGDSFMKATQRRTSYAAVSIGALLGLAVFSAGFAEPRNEQTAPAAVKRQKT